MARTGKRHHELDENGVGSCSVPMWDGYGMPNGFCDEPAYGKQVPCRTFVNYAAGGEVMREDGKFNGHVPGLACPMHGGPSKETDNDG